MKGIDPLIITNLLPSNGYNVVEFSRAPRYVRKKQLEELGGYISVDTIWNFPKNVTREQIERAIA